MLFFHNHPNPDPGNYDCTKPSNQDVEVARARSEVLNARGVNYLAFVCERGRPYEYFLSPADGFMPVLDFARDIERQNGKTRLGNLSLHLRRLFG